MPRSSAVVSTVLHRRVVEASVVISARVRVVDPALAYVRAAGTDDNVERPEPVARGERITRGEGFVMRPSVRRDDPRAVLRVEERVRRAVVRARGTTVSRGGTSR